MSHQLNTTFKWAKTEGTELLTKFSQTLNAKSHDKRKSFFCARVSDSKWLVMNKHHLHDGDEDKECCIYMKPPHFVNVYCVQIDESKQHCKCTCAHKRRTGRPCVHVISVCDAVNHEMYHPRYYKVYNSSDMYQDDKIHRALQSIRDEHEKYPEFVKIHAFIDELMNPLLKSRNGTTEENAEVMKSAFASIDSGTVFLQSDLMSLKDRSSASTNASFHEDELENLDGNISFDMSESSGSFSQDSVNHKKGNGKHDASHDRKNYSYVNAIVKECSKFCEGRPLLWDLMNAKIEEMHSAIIREYKILNDSKKRTQCDDEQNSNTLVSSNLPIEKCPGRKRYKSYHEKF